MSFPTGRDFQEEQTATVIPTLTELETPSPVVTSTNIPSHSETPWPVSQSTDLLSNTLPSETPAAFPLVYPEPKGVFESDEVLVRLRSSAESGDLDNCLGTLEFEIDMKIEDLKVLVLKIQDGLIAQALGLLNSCAAVKYAEPNYLASIADTFPNDSGFGNQYGLLSIHAPQGWDLSTGSPAVIIAIVDSGVDLSHADLAGKIVAGYDFVNSDNVPQDDYGHGTHVAGIAAATSNDGIGVAGVSWGARIMPVKVLNSSGGGSFANVAAGIVWAVDNGAQVINLSLGGPSPSLVLQDAVNYAYSKGVVLVAAAGNTGSGFVLYPAAYPHVIAVGAVDNTNSRAGFSNYGAELDLMAPGASIYSTLPGTYGYLSGTSMAAPYVSGLAAILRGYPAGGSPDAIEFEMESTALDLGPAGRDNLNGYGLIQMDHAIQLVYIPPTSAFTSTPTKTLTANPAGNQLQIFSNGSDSSGTSNLTPRQTPFSTATNSLIITMTPTDVVLGQETATSELYALTSPESQKKQPLSTYFLPCLGVLLIGSGIWLFLIAGRRQDRQRTGKWMQ